MILAEISSTFFLLTLMQCNSHSISQTTSYLYIDYSLETPLDWHTDVPLFVFYFFTSGSKQLFSHHPRGLISISSPCLGQDILPSHSYWPARTSFLVLSCRKVTLNEIWVVRSNSHHISVLIEKKIKYPCCNSFNCQIIYWGAVIWVLLSGIYMFFICPWVSSGCSIGNL